MINGKGVNMKRWFLMGYIIFYGMTLGILGVEAAEVYCSLKDGKKADGKTVFEHGGTKHEFCCSGCLAKFKANPEKFAQQVQQPTLKNTADAEAACSSVCSG